MGKRPICARPVPRPVPMAIAGPNCSAPGSQSIAISRNALAHIIEIGVADRCGDLTHPGRVAVANGDLRACGSVADGSKIVHLIVGPTVQSPRSTAVCDVPLSRRYRRTSAGSLPTRRESVTC
jgi:hypothetical protein